MRSSTIPSEFRELPDGARQRKREWELTSERLSEIYGRGSEPTAWKVDADGARPLQRERYKIRRSGFVSHKSMNCVHKTGVVPRKMYRIFRLRWQKPPDAEVFLYDRSFLLCNTSVQQEIPDCMKA